MAVGLCLSQVTSCQAAVIRAIPSASHGYNPHPLQHHQALPALGKSMEQRIALLPSVAAEDIAAGKHFSPCCNVPIVLEIAYYEGVNF